jgi:GntR family transcriptional repressor for pyruvate dehydrogenase complex
MATRKSPASRKKTEVREPFQIVERTSLSENIVKELLALISSGDIKPGQKLPGERELCTYFGVGRSSLREAISCLVVIGVLEISIGNGTYLAKNAESFVKRVLEWRILTERQSLDNLMEVRRALESAAAASAAICGTEDQFEQLENILGNMRRSMKQPMNFRDYDFEFHVLVARASGNPLLFDLLSMIRGQLSDVILAFGGVPGARTVACKHHAFILKALKERNESAARSAMENHLAIGLKRYRAAHQKSGAGSEAKR